jgi:hypothetical protein
VSSELSARHNTLTIQLSIDTICYNRHILTNFNMEKSASSAPILSGSSIAENVVPEPRRSGRARTSTQCFESLPQPASSASKTSVKRKRSDPTHNDKIDQQQNTRNTHTQAGSTTKNPKPTSTRVANNKPSPSNHANAKPTTKSRPSQHAGNVIDLTTDDGATSSKKSKRAKPGKGEEKRLKP